MAGAAAHGEEYGGVDGEMREQTVAGGGGGGRGCSERDDVDERGARVQPYFMWLCAVSYIEARHRLG